MTVYRQAPAVDAPAARLPVTWSSREPTLSPRGAVAEGEAARVWARRMLGLRDEALAGLRGVAGDGVLAVIADACEVPWCDGLRWMGRDPDAPAVWTPTTTRPSVSAALIERALAARAGTPSPWMIWPDEARLRVVSLATARAVDRERLRAWLEAT